MKPLILLLLIPLLACSREHDHTHDHEHPFMGHDHRHEHDIPNHNHLFPLGLPFTYIVSVYPPPTVPGYPPFGFLKGPNYDHNGTVIIEFSGPPENLNLTNIDYPHYDSTPVTGWGVRRSTYFNQAKVYSDCSDPEHTGYIAFQLEWDDGLARFYYKCEE